MRPILLLEMNEVPWRVIDRALSDRRFSGTRRLFSSARTFSTVSSDVFDLSPWVTWPSLHRGLRSEDHCVKSLGQDPSTFRGKPIWQEYRDRGASIGVCGSLQSWPPIDPGEGGFFIPDTFAADDRCIPDYIAPLQRLNLGMVRKNGGVIRRGGLLTRESLAALPAAVRARITPRTCARLAKQLVLERIDKAALARRPTFQTLLYWDIFKGLFDPRRPPAFASFFTNHIAGVMHRYWHQVFPEDFQERASSGGRPHVATLDFALRVMDAILRDALGFQQRCPELIVVFATSMGQAAVHRRSHEGFTAAVTDVGKLMATFGGEQVRFKPLLAMVPQVALEIPDAASRARVVRHVASARTASDRPVFLRAEERGTRVSLTLSVPSRADRVEGSFRSTSDTGDVVFTAWKSAGITFHDVDAGTGYHVAEGVMAAVGRGITPDGARTRIWATDVKAYLLQIAGLDPR